MNGSELTSWRDVLDGLSEFECAVEFLRFKVDFPYSLDTVVYAALMLKPGMEYPFFIPLFEERELTKEIHLMANRSQINDLYKFSLQGESNELHRLIWEQLEGEMNGVRKIYCSPIGELNRINLGAIPINRSSTFGDQYDLVLVGSTRQLVVKEPKLQDGEDRTAYVLGGVHYQCDSTFVSDRDLIADRGDDNLDDTFSDSTYRGTVLRYLPHSMEEAIDVQALLTNTGFSVQLDTAQLATEAAFKQLGSNGPSPSIIHAATHGYFFPDPKLNKDGVAEVNSTNAYRMAVQPLMRSGILLSCSAEAWSAGGGTDGSEDGVLTAYEISQMDLRGTELVVLSACETALGDIVGTEGVYGLQRAFRIAGVKNLIMTLWKVNDAVSKQFFTGFYEYYIKDKMSIHDAFRTAQSDLRKLYPESPYLWAGFILLQ